MSTEEYPIPAPTPIFLGDSPPPPYKPHVMTRPQIEFSIKIFILLLIIAFGAAAIHVLRTLGWA